MKAHSVNVGDQVHLHSRQGCFTVHDVTDHGFSIMKNREYIFIHWSDFKCLKGEGTSPEAELRRKFNFEITLAEQNVALKRTVLKLLRK
jgi:hypothetical protein